MTQPTRSGETRFQQDMVGSKGVTRSNSLFSQSESCSTEIYVLLSQCVGGSSLPSKHFKHNLDQKSRWQNCANNPHPESSERAAGAPRFICAPLLYYPSMPPPLSLLSPVASVPFFHTTVGLGPAVLSSFQTRIYSSLGRLAMNCCALMCAKLALPILTVLQLTVCALMCANTLPILTALQCRIDWKGTSC